MNVQIHSVRFDADKKLIDFVHQKLDKLTQFGYCKCRGLSQVEQRSGQGKQD